jgi:hypothetical protein
MADKLLTGDGEPMLSNEQRSMIKMLDMMKDSVKSGQVGQIGVITVGAAGINVGFNDVDYGGLMIGTEMLKGMVMARITQPKSSPIMRTRMRPGS